MAKSFVPGTTNAQLKMHCDPLKIQAAACSFKYNYTNFQFTVIRHTYFLVNLIIPKTHTHTHTPALCKLLPENTLHLFKQNKLPHERNPTNPKQ